MQLVKIVSIVRQRQVISTASGTKAVHNIINVHYQVIPMNIIKLHFHEFLRSSAHDSGIIDQASMSLDTMYGIDGDSAK